MPDWILPDLQDEIKPDNKKLFNLMDKARWDRLIQQVKDGGDPEELLEELIEGE